MIKKRKLTPKAVRSYSPVLICEVPDIRKAFLSDEPVRSIARRYGIDAGTVYYHCRDLLEVREPRPKGRPARRIAA